MKLTKLQIEKLYYFLSILVNDETDILAIKFMGSDIIVIAEPQKGEITNRGWEITPKGELNDIPRIDYY